jgi:16S rRNA C967 or C1407 C5-methylase (RsmB/RsmF family)
MEALADFSKHPPRAIRLNALKEPDSEELMRLLDEQGFVRREPVSWEPRGYFADLSTVKNISSQPVLGAGLVYIQEPGAMEAVSLLDPQPGERILDLCAAPGGKATQIGERMKGRGWLVVNEPVRSRAERLDLLLARQGVLNASVYALDPSSLSERYGLFFDRILVDAPCSGESLFAKRSDFRSDVRDVDVTGCARRQIMILSRAAEMLKPGGVLVYSTCTYSREENEDVVRAFLESFPMFRLTHEQRRWPHRDRVAGGFAARFVCEGEQVGLTPSSLGAREESAGLIRHGYRKWNGELDEYAVAMSAVDLEAVRAQAIVSTLSEAPLPTALAEVTVDDASAHAYLRGESLPQQNPLERGPMRLTWRGYPLGSVKAVGDRLNNLLPKILRG